MQQKSLLKAKSPLDGGLGACIFWLADPDSSEHWQIGLQIS